MRKAIEFTKVIGFQCVATGDFLQIFAKPNNFDYPRLGMIVAKKKVRRAVDRNKVKRLLREYFRVNQHSKATIGMDWVIRIRRPVARSEAHVLLGEIKTLMLHIKQCQD